MMTMYLNRDDIIRMAIDAIGGDMNGQDAQHLTWRLEHFKDDSYEFGPDALLKFVALVAAAEREKMKWEGIHTCNPDCQKPACVAVREAVAAEREACAEACERAVGSASMYQDIDFANAAYRVKNYCQELIRARGK